MAIYCNRIGQARNELPASILLLWTASGILIIDTTGDMETDVTFDFKREIYWHGIKLIAPLGPLIPER
jgi:hypothetical protein